MAITDKTRKRLWAASGGRCAKCRCRLVHRGSQPDGDAVVGDECHIVGRTPTSARAGEPIPGGDMDGYDNLILLCASDHRLIDSQPRRFPTATVCELKGAHERWVEQSLEVSVRAQSETVQLRLTHAQAACVRARRDDRQRAVELRSELRQARAESVPASRTRGDGRSRVGDLSEQAVCARPEDGPTHSDLRRQRRRRHARRVRSAAGAHYDQREHAGRRLRRPVHHRQHGERESAVVAGRHSRVRREDRRAPLGLSYDSASGRVRLRHVAGRRVEGLRRRERVVRRDDRSATRHRLRRDRLGGLRFLRRESHRRRSVREHAARARCQDRQTPLALSGGDVTTSGIGISPPRRRSSPCSAMAATSTRSHRSRRPATSTSSSVRRASRSSRSSIAKSPASTVDGERAAEMQPYPVAPPPFVRQTLTEDMLTTRTTAAHDSALKLFREYKTSGMYDPPNTRGTIIFPGVDGGGEWGGPAFDPAIGIVVRQRQRDAVVSQARRAQRPFPVRRELRELSRRRPEGIARHSVARRGR